MSNHLIIPLAGYGKRFVKAGYKNLKPFLKIDNSNNMIRTISKYDIGLLLIISYYSCIHALF